MSLVAPLRFCRDSTTIVETQNNPAGERPGQRLGTCVLRRGLCMYDEEPHGIAVWTGNPGTEGDAD